MISKHITLKQGKGPFSKHKKIGQVNLQSSDWTLWCPVPVWGGWMGCRRTHNTKPRHETSFKAQKTRPGHLQSRDWTLWCHVPVWSARMGCWRTRRGRSRSWECSWGTGRSPGEWPHRRLRCLALRECCMSWTPGNPQNSLSSSWGTVLID